MPIGRARRTYRIACLYDTQKKSYIMRTIYATDEDQDRHLYEHVSTVIDACFKCNSHDEKMNRMYVIVNQMKRGTYCSGKYAMFII